ncbi:MAG: hypothetical protein ACJ796_15265 [Gemmatimonadaceae bacterium]
MPFRLIRDALGEPPGFVPTLARRLGAALPGPPLSMAKHVGPSVRRRSAPHPPQRGVLTQRSAPRRSGRLR